MSWIRSLDLRDKSFNPSTVTVLISGFARIIAFLCPWISSVTLSFMASFNFEQLGVETLFYYAPVLPFTPFTLQGPKFFWLFTRAIKCHYFSELSRQSCSIGNKELVGTGSEYVLLMTWQVKYCIARTCLIKWFISWRIWYFLSKTGV